MRRLALLPVVFLFLLPGYTYAQEFYDIRSAAVLKDIGPVRVLVEELGDKAEGFGLHKADIQRDVELKLRIAGITVISDGGGGYLYVKVVSSCRDDISICGYGVSVDYREEVSVVRSIKLHVWDAITWKSTGSIGTVGVGSLREVRDSVKDGVDEFINAYLTANPKR